jgi:hypothetical protein
MRLITLLLAACVIAGCSSAPKPHDCEGEFRPVNKEQKSASLSAKEQLAMCVNGGHYGRV